MTLCSLNSVILPLNLSRLKGSNDDALIPVSLAK